MAKLIVEEGGKRRAFRMSKGVLTVGSGAEARLRLTSTQVAEIHLDLEVTEARVMLRPRPGVVAPRVGGRPAGSEVALQPGQRVELGDAALWIEAEEGETLAPPVTAPASAPVAARPAAARARSTRNARHEREARGLPAWASVLFVLAVAGLGLFVWARTVQKGAGGAGLAENKLRAARQAATSGSFADALRELGEIPEGALTPELAEEKSALEREYRQRDQDAQALLANQAGTRYLDTMLRKYEGLYLQGTPEPAKVRLFLLRCKTFHARWPTHPEMDWVERQEARFAGHVDLLAPPTWADVQWEVRDLTDTSPRNYVAALQLLDEFMARASGGERTEADGLRDTLIAERAEYATDRLYQAKYEFEKKNDPSKAVWWLIHNIAWLGDEALADESARFLVKIPDLPGHLRGYLQNYPDRYAAVMRNRVVSAWAAETGFTP